MKRKIQSDNPWVSETPVNITRVFHSCLGYSMTPAWVSIRQAVREVFGSFAGLRTIELGCGEGKMSLLFSLLGAETTLVDNGPTQIERAKFIARQFFIEPVFIKENVLELPKSFLEQFYMSMSFGTAEHFFGKERQEIFDVHCGVLRKGGLTSIWVPNRYGILFHLGVAIRKLARKRVSKIPEASFSRKELYRHANKAGLSALRVFGGELLANDFNNFILDIRPRFRLSKNRKTITEIQEAKKKLSKSMAENHVTIRPWNNLLSYPLVLMGKKN
jgi:SAM-dependent methyltransferase